MKKVILLIIIILLQSFPSFGNPNGKGLICKCEDCNEVKLYHENKELGFLFNKNRVEK